MKLRPQTILEGDGLYLIDKPVGISSFGVVAHVRRVLGIRKVGHAGTLDPLASGLMIILAGKDYTRKADQFLKLDKVYEVKMELGRTSNTGDREGELTSLSDKRPSKSEIDGALLKFNGQIMQKPPIYSAIKIAGQRAYKLARRGENPSIPSRNVTVYDIKNVQYSYPFVSFTVRVSSGTYIRSLVTDIGEALGTGAYMSSLRRTQIGEYHLDAAIKLENSSQHK